MSTTTIAAPPSSPVFGHLARFVAALAAAPAAPAPGVPMPHSAFFNLLRLSGGVNSVDPALLAERIVQE
ncbi:hypothetical protein [Massilia niastensis]|uniref:hypothetical protein n=1 Tax=Massilia niastensis TaxID=544911 RepID=UPI00037BB0BE|nr:hypothetical protein [Massilia niastensis]